MGDDQAARGLLAPLVAPYRAIQRDSLSDTPLLRAMGVFGVSTWPIGCDSPSSFSERFPLGEHAKWRCDTTPTKGGISAILARYPMKTRQNACDTPSEILSRKRYCAIWRGISHWAAKLAPSVPNLLPLFFQPQGDLVFHCVLLTEA